MKGKNKRKNIYDKYREILEMPNLSNSQIDNMREHLILFAKTICEYVWRNKYY